MAQRFLSLCRRYVVLGATFACLAGINIASDATAEHYLDPRWSVAAGGQLFDNWFNTLMVDAPRAAHPLYPRGGGLYGRDTWRCVSCHGWGTASGTDMNLLDREIAATQSIPARRDLIKLRQIISERGFAGLKDYVKLYGSKGLPAVAGLGVLPQLPSESSQTPQGALSDD